MMDSFIGRSRGGGQGEVTTGIDVHTYIVGGAWLNKDRENRVRRFLTMET
jgi:hypothetical protein